MKIAYFDCFAGASGDMILGSLMDAGLETAQLKAELAKLRLTHYDLQVKKVVKNGDAFLLDRIFEIALRDDAFYVRQIPMMMMVMVFIHQHCGLTATNTPFNDFFNLKIIMAQVQFGQFPF